MAFWADPSEKVQTPLNLMFWDVTVGFFSPPALHQVVPPLQGGKEIWHAGEFIHGLSTYSDSLGQDTAQLSCLLST